eukprot:TRINITY_DN16363_c0_g1_i1.p1 TRINITY_DN16363_c0_g1~~TRINITY_DN16363_c0_g1_i1.p1  ORF type:complete len:935 (+),score=169.22 TRINITY_DN16363_c0_g1_i1:60-2864(+)
MNVNGETRTPFPRRVRSPLQTPLLVGHANGYPEKEIETRRRHFKGNVGGLLSKLQGKWATSSGQVAHVTRNQVVFTFPDGTVLPPTRELVTDSHGRVTLLGSAVLQVSSARATWSDNDVWMWKQDAPQVVHHPISPVETTISPMQSTRTFDRPSPMALELETFPPQTIEQDHAPAPPAAVVVQAPPDTSKKPGPAIVDNEQSHEEGLGSRKHADGTATRRFSTAPLATTATKKMRSVLCCCFRARDVGDTYADVEEGKHNPEDGVNPLVIKKVRSVLIHARKRIPSTQMLGKVLCLALKRLPHSANYSLKTRWECVLLAAPEDEEEITNVLKNLAKGKNEPVIPYAMHHIVRTVELWWAVDTDNSGYLDFKEVTQLMDRLNVSIQRSKLKKKFDEFDVDGDEKVDFDEFMKFFEKLQFRTELTTLYQTVCSKSERTFTENMLDFLNNTQQDESSTVRSTGKLIQEWSTDDDPNKLTLHDFSKYITSTANSWWVEQRLPNDLQHPLTHYYISSSHNTYLSGNQVSSESKAEMYTYALERGCKCLEIDCWDGPNNDPVVTHGHTATSKILFSDVVRAIDASAFVVSELPVIVSLEVHTSIAQQSRMAEIMSDIWQGKMQSITGIEDINDPKFSPNGLRNKILVKGPKLNHAGRAVDMDEKDDETNPTNQKKIAPTLSDTIFFKNTKLRPGGVKDHLGSAGGIGEVTSLSEKALNTIIKAKERLSDMNMGVMTRIYPQGTRIASMNFNPVPAWANGSQLVALNFQTGDYPVRLNQAFFKQNGGCGYVLKPAKLRKKQQMLSEPTHRLTVEVISGGCLPKPNLAARGEIIDPFVVVAMSANERDDTWKKPFQTKSVTDNGFNPIWGTTFHFSVTEPATAILTLRVMDHDIVGGDDFIGEASCPFLQLRQGYRSIPLHDAHYRLIPGTFLLVRIKITID